MPKLTMETKIVNFGQYLQKLNKDKFGTNLPPTVQKNIDDSVSKLVDKYGKLLNAEERTDSVTAREQQDKYNWADKEDVKRREDNIKRFKAIQTLYEAIEKEAREMLAKLVPLSEPAENKKAWIDEKIKSLLGDDKDKYEESHKTLFIIKNELTDAQKRTVEDTARRFGGTKVEWTKTNGHFICEITCSGGDPVINEKNLRYAMEQMSKTLRESGHPSGDPIEIIWAGTYPCYKNSFYHKILGGAKAEADVYNNANNIANEKWRKEFNQDKGVEVDSSIPNEENDNTSRNNSTLGRVNIKP